MRNLIIEDEFNLADVISDSTSKIKLTSDSYVTTLEDDDTTYSNIDIN